MPAHEPKRVSLRDLAAKAGLSHSTVSLALRDHPAIAVKTRDRVRALAASLNYRPDPMLTALAEYRKERRGSRYQATLGWLNFFADSDTPGREPFNYRTGAQERADQLGYKLDVFAASPSAQHLRQLTRVLKTRNIQGLLFSPLPESGDIEFDFSAFSAIAFGHSLKSPRLNIVTNHQAFSSILALQELRRKGFRRIGLLISRDLDERSRHNFYGGFLGEQMTLPARERVPPRIHPTSTMNQQQMNLLIPWFNRYRPDAIISHYSELPALLERNGLRVPQDIALAWLSVGTTQENGPNSTTGVNQNEITIGRTAVNLLSAMLYRNERGIPEAPSVTLIDGFWQDGKTMIPRSQMATQLPLIAQSGVSPNRRPKK